MHPQVTMLRYDAVAIAQRHCCSNGCGLVPLCRVDAANDTSLQKEGAGAIFHSAGEAHKIIDLSKCFLIHSFSVVHASWLVSCRSIIPHSAKIVVEVHKTYGGF